MSYKLNPANKVPYREVRVPEAANRKVFEMNLRRSGQNGLPGFVIRASGLIDIGVRTPEQLADLVIDTLRNNPDIGMHQVGELARLSLPKIKSPGLGDLHHDFMPHIPPDLRIHTTDGEGKLILANSGTAHSAASPWLAQPEIDELFLEGFVDPATINPIVYTTTLSTGDNVIFPSLIFPRSTHDNAGPIWHRFDTSSATRQGEARFIDFDNN